MIDRPMVALGRCCRAAGGSRRARSAFGALLQRAEASESQVVVVGR